MPNPWFPPFCCRSAVAVSPFRSAFRCTVAVAGENGNAGNVFTYKDEVTRPLIGCPSTAERQRNGGNQGLFSLASQYLYTVAQF